MRNAFVLFSLLPALAAAGPQDFGGPWTPPHDEIPDEQRARIHAMLAGNVAKLLHEGKLTTAPASPLQANLQWPLRPTAGYKSPGYHGISNFVDLNPNYPNQLLDFACGARTYDQAGGYNHAGTDFFTWPFPWALMDAQAIDIVAAAPGVIIGKSDGNNDRSCPNNYSADWNAVYIRHADNSVAWYGHMKLGSLTTKAIGASVATGEFLGKVGSSGFSSGPHLHFENYNASNQLVEPWAGQCRTGASLWAQQAPYYDSAINRLATHSAPPTEPNPNCPNPVAETLNLDDNVQRGQSVTFASYYRDQMAGQVANMAILRPNGTAFQSWNFDMGTQVPDTYYSASYWYRTYTMPADAPYGLWKFRSVFQGKTTIHRFTVGDVLFADDLGG